MGKASRIAIVVVLVAAVVAVVALKEPKGAATDAKAKGAPPPAKPLPRLVDLGAAKCIPCKMMAPILEELKAEYAGRFDVEFIDVWQDETAGQRYGIKMIPTQIFFDASGKELFRHEGFYSKEDILGKWKELGFDLAGSVPTPTFERLAPAQKDTRPRDQVCYMCDGNISPKTLVVVKTAKGDVRLCGPHHYFVMYSCLTEDKAGFEKKVSVTDWATGKLVPAVEAICLYGVGEKTGRPTIKAFADRDAAAKEMQSSGGSLIAFAALQEKELAHRCGFCDRAVYPQDAARVLVGGIQTWGCCSHCALGVAARTGKDIDVHERDRLTGEAIVVKTLDGKIASLEPTTAVAWFGQRKKPDGSWGSAGCFHQGFFVSAGDLKKWVESQPYETGRLIPIQKALADKMKLTPQQVQKACKIGECAPK
ncbi:thioredoxin fold domain-containing protein [bacterium]|nr:thioredoxin fold domain-containing protein [bacterium]